MSKLNHHRANPPDGHHHLWLAEVGDCCGHRGAARNRRGRKAALRKVDRREWKRASERKIEHSD